MRGTGRRRGWPVSRSLWRAEECVDMNEWRDFITGAEREASGRGFLTKGRVLPPNRRGERDARNRAAERLAGFVLSGARRNASI